MKFEDALKYCRYRPGLTGKGIRIAVMELYAPNEPGPTVPLPMARNPSYTHADMVLAPIKHIVPDAEIFVVPNTVAGGNWVLENGIHLLGMSLGDGILLENVENKIAKKTFMLTSAGNKAGEGETHAAARKAWCAVGAAELRLGAPKMESYSSYGGGHVVTAGLTDYYLDGYRVWGTSGARPLVLALLAQYYQHHHETLGYYPAPRSAYEFVKMNSHDFDHDGKDFKSGYGVFRLPKQFELEEIILHPSIQTVERIKYVEGKVEKNENEVAYVEPYISDGRMRIGIRDAELLGLTAHWEQKNRTVHIAR